MSLPPSLHCVPPIQLGGDALSGCTSEPWTQETRCAAVNAFCFGGINAHVVLESRARYTLDLRCRSAFCPHTCLVSRRCGRSHDQHGWAPNGIDRGPCRVVLHAPDAAKLERARDHSKVAAMGRTTSGTIQILYYGKDNSRSCSRASKLVFASNIRPYAGTQQ